MGLHVGFRRQRLQSSYFKDVQIIKGKYGLNNCTDMESQQTDLKRTKWKYVIDKKNMVIEMKIFLYGLKSKLEKIEGRIIKCENRSTEIT